MRENGVGWTEVHDRKFPGADLYFDLTDAQLRAKLEPEKGIFIAESQTVIEVALENGCRPISVLCDRRLLNDRVIDTVAKCYEANPGLSAFLADHEVIREISGFELTRGMLCAMARPQARTANELCRDARLIAVLERISDSTNVGAIMRAAAGIGVDALLLTPDCCDPLCRRSVRVSMGTVFSVPWAYIPAFPQAGRDLRALGFETVALALRKDARPIDDPLFRGAKKLALIFGSEGYGLREETIAQADHTAIIPMQNGVDSLNVASAAAVAFWELRRRSDTPDGK